MDWRLCFVNVCPPRTSKRLPFDKDQKKKPAEGRTLCVDRWLRFVDVCPPPTSANPSEGVARLLARCEIRKRPSDEPRVTRPVSSWWRTLHLAQCSERNRASDEFERVMGGAARRERGGVRVAVQLPRSGGRRLHLAACYRRVPPPQVMYGRRLTQLHDATNTPGRCRVCRSVASSASMLWERRAAEERRPRERVIIRGGEHCVWCSSLRPRWVCVCGAGRGSVSLLCVGCVVLLFYSCVVCRVVLCVWCTSVVVDIIMYSTIVCFDSHLCRLCASDLL